MSISFRCGCGFAYEGDSFDEEDALHERFKLTARASCCNCSGVRCMSCVFREMHDQCLDDCPSCISTSDDEFIAVIQTEDGNLRGYR
jgi:hypothetical protein